MTVRRARAWLGAQGIAHSFHDFKKAGVPADRLDAWLAARGRQQVLNRRGTAWRKLDEGTQSGVVEAASACAVMLPQPSVIKRPVVEWAGPQITVDHDAQDWAARVAL